VYDSFILWTMKQTPVFDMVSADDISGDGNADVMVSAGYVLYAINGKDGSVIWSFGSTDNVWDVEVTGDMSVLFDIDIGAMPPSLSPRDYTTPAQSMMLWSGLAVGLLALGLFMFERREVS
jgi:hypothetical protein